MTDIPAQTSPEAGVQAEDEAYYHESALNAAWTGSRLAIGGLTFLYACFAFAYFYLRSVNSSGRWQGSGFIQPSVATGTIIMVLAVLSLSGSEKGGHSWRSRFTAFRSASATSSP